MRRHAEAAALFNSVSVLYVESDDTIKKTKVNITNSNKITELIIKYPRVVNKLPIVSKIIKVRRFKKNYEYGLNLLREKGFYPDIIHCNIMNPVGIIGKIWRDKFDLPYVITEHWTGFLPSDGRYSKNKLLKLSLPGIANCAEKILPVSLDLKTALIENNLGKRFQIIHNVVNTDKFFPKNSAKNRFLVVADLDNNQKNITGIINAFNIFSRKNPKIILSIAGGGDDQEIIMKQITKMNLLDKIKLHGRVSPEKLNNLLGQSHASILFSNYENLPCVIIEAFAAGVPFISTKVGGVEEIINKDRGILIPIQDEKELVEAMKQVLITKWDKKAIRDYAINSFSYQKIGEELNSVYAEIIDK